MIVVRLMGGLGNQMFQYAFGCSLASDLKTEFKYEVDELEKKNRPNSFAVYRAFELDAFSITASKVSTSELQNYQLKPSSESFFSKFLFKLNTLFGKYKVVYQNGQRCDKGKLNIQNNSFVIGRWQSESFFINVKEIIKTEFKFKNRFIDSNEYYSKIKNSVAVAVHVRRGDYVDNKLYAEGIGALDLNYYKNAIDYLNSKLVNLTFYVFSDDIAWCKEHLKLDNLVYVQQQGEFQKAEYDLQLISCCKHHIISNSTFSWWGAWLAEGADSVIIAPKVWARKIEFIPENIIPNRWINIENTFEEIK